MPVAGIGMRQRGFWSRWARSERCERVRECERGRERVAFLYGKFRHPPIFAAHIAQSSPCLKTIFAFLWSLCASCILYGQGKEFMVHFETYTTEHGLSSNHIYDCFQDSRGILWLVREGGIDRFDGEEFKPFNYPELKTTASMEFLLEDADHDLWIRRNDKTIVYFNIFTEKLRSSEEKFGPTFPKRVNWAIPGMEGSYLLQVEGSNILRYFPGKTPRPYYSTPGKVVSPLIEYPDGTAWSESNNNHLNGELIATDKNGKEIIKIPYNAEHIFGKGVWGHDTIHYITKDSFYLASFKGIVLRKPLNSLFINYVFSDPYQNGRFQKITVEQDRGLVWVYYPYQILLFDKSLRLLYTFDNKKYFVQSSNVYDMFTDKQNHTWICTFDGLHNVTFKPNPFHQFIAEDPGNIATYNPKSTRKICKAADGNIYVIASNQLFRITPGGKVENILNMPDLAAMDQDDQGHLWFSNDLLYRYNIFTGELKHYGSKLDFGNWLVKNVDNRLWFGFPLKTLDIANIHAGQETVMETFEGSDRFDIYDIVRKNDNQYYLATAKGLLVFEPGKGIQAHYSEAGTGRFKWPVSNIRQIHIDQAGDCWMATSDGLFYWQPATETFRLYQSVDGVHPNCSAVLEDDYGFLWISSDFGLMQFDKKTKLVRTYLSSDGLPSDEFNRLAYFEDQETGDMYMGGLNGLVKFHPKDFLSDDLALQSNTNLVLTECLLFSGKTNQEEDIRALVLQKNQITIEPGDLFLRIKFALTDYTKPTAITYSYLIDGYNKNWHTGTENELLISGLPDGHYTLRVRAITPNGLPSNHEIQLPIRVLPPFYRQTWFLALLGLSAVSAIFWYVRRRTRILTERTAMLEVMVSERTEVIENQRKSLKELYDSKSRLYANITHEFRTPLTLILGPAKQALKSAEAINNPDIQRNITNILTNSEQLLGLVNQMLDLNKLESKAMAPHFDQEDIIAALHQMVERFQHYAASHYITLTFLPGVERLLMDFDVEMVEKILNNLLSNAVKFTPAHGEITVKAHAIDGILQVQVRDTGKGIHPDQLPYIFDRFYQADNSATRQSEGTGIGLALVKELVALLDGTISVQSTPGTETVFTLQLPIRNQAPLKEATMLPIRTTVFPGLAKPVPVLEGSNNGDSGKPSIIIIEDHPAVANYIASCLLAEYAVTIMNSSIQGLAAVRERLPDMVVCDLMMPEMDGYEVCTTLKLDERTSHIPVVFLSAVTEQAERLKRLNAGADAYISKPFREEELQTVVGNLLASRNLLRSKYLARSSGADSESVEPTESLNPLELEFLNKARIAILANLEKAEFDGAMLARILGFSNSQLHRKLTALTGLSAGRYIHQVRLESARELLRRKELSVSDVAYQTGFSDPAYFTRLFTKTFGQSPREYRSSL